jgi:hypothetical protein
MKRKQILLHNKQTINKFNLRIKLFSKLLSNSSYVTLVSLKIFKVFRFNVKKYYIFWCLIIFKNINSNRNYKFSNKLYFNKLLFMQIL